MKFPIDLVWSECRTVKPRLLFLFIAKNKNNFGRGRECSLSFAMKRDKKEIKAIPFGSLV